MAGARPLCGRLDKELTLVAGRARPGDEPERAGMDITEVACSHAVYVSQPDAVADLVRRAAER